MKSMSCFIAAIQTFFRFLWPTNAFVAHIFRMTVYLIVAVIWFALELPIHAWSLLVPRDVCSFFSQHFHSTYFGFGKVLAPMFFADPMGAVVGKCPFWENVCGVCSVWSSGLSIFWLCCQVGWVGCAFTFFPFAR